jgi:hypothetical protein
VVADPARRPRRSTAGQKDLTAGMVELLRDLAPRLAASDHQHRAGRKPRGVPVVLHVDLKQVHGQRGGSRRPVRSLIRTDTEDHRLRAHLTSGRLQAEAPVLTGLERRDLDALAHGRLESRCVALQKSHHLVTRHETVGVLPVVAVAGELDAPIRRDQKLSQRPRQVCAIFPFSGMM